MNYDQFFLAVNYDRLTPTERIRLKRHLPKKMLEADCDRFLSQVSWRIDIWEKLPKSVLSPAEIGERIEDLEAACTAMRRAVLGLEMDALDVLKPHFDYLSWGSDPVVDLPEVFRDEKPPFKQALEAVLTGVNMLQTLGEFARSEMNIDRSLKPSQQRARGLVYTIAEAWWFQFRELPPTGKTSCFFALIRDLGEIVGLKKPIGNALVAGVIKGMRNPLESTS